MRWPARLVVALAGMALLAVAASALPLPGVGANVRQNIRPPYWRSDIPVTITLGPAQAGLHRWPSYKGTSFFNRDKNVAPTKSRTAPVSAQEPARKARGTEEYRIAYWPADEEQAAIAAEAAALAIQRLQHALNVTLQRRIEIELCHTNREFNERTGENNPLWIQGRAFPREYRIVVKALGPRRIRTLVAHEIVHVLLQRKLDETGAPTLRWLHEGLAKYVTGDLPMGDQELLARAATQGRLLTLDELEPAFSGKLEQVSLAYAQSYTLVEYLTSLEGKTGLSGFLAELGHIKDADRALVRAYQMPVAQLEADWLRHINRLYLGRRGPNVFGDWLWGAVAILFIIALVVQLRRSGIIRRRMQEEELLSQIMAADTSVETEVEEAE